MRTITMVLVAITAAVITASFAPGHFAPVTEDSLATISTRELERSVTNAPDAQRWDAH